MTIHRFDKGDRVAVFNSKSETGEPIFEGNATVTARLDTDHYYEVRFDQERDAVYARFAFVAPGTGNEADDYLEDLRAKWRLLTKVPA